MILLNSFTAPDILRAHGYCAQRGHGHSRKYHDPKAPDAEIIMGVTGPLKRNDRNRRQQRLARRLGTACGRSRGKREFLEAKSHRPAVEWAI